MLAERIDDIGLMGDQDRVGVGRRDCKHLAACHISERSLLELAGHYGIDKVQQYLTELIDYSERMTHAAIRELPTGVYGFLDHIDDDGIDVGKPIPSR